MNKEMDEKLENKSPKQAKTRPNGKNMTQQQVKQEILAMVDSGENYRAIAKIPFKVDGVVRRFSISQISMWKQERDMKASEEGEASMASKAFKLFEEGQGPVQAVIKLSIEPEDANAYYKSYLELKQQDLSAPSVPRRLKELESTVRSLEDTQIFSMINPAIGCGNLDCSAQDENKLEVEAFCTVCGWSGKTRVNFET